MKSTFSFLHLLFSISIAMIGYNIHKSILWSIVDFLFSGFVLIKWFICHEINLSVIKDTFSWFFV